MALPAGPEDVSGPQVSGQTNINGGGEGGVNSAVAASKDDVSTINAVRAQGPVAGRGSRTSWGMIYQIGASGAKDGGY